MASSSSWSVLTPKRGMEVLERLELWDSFLTPLMWLMGLSFRVGDGISTSFCLSARWKKHIYSCSKVDYRHIWKHVLVWLTQESAGDVFGHLVARATHL